MFGASSELASVMEFGFNEAKTQNPLKFAEVPQTHQSIAAAKFNLLGSEKCYLANLVANRDWLIVTVLQATACIFGQF